MRGLMSRHNNSSSGNPSSIPSKLRADKNAGFPGADPLGPGFSCEQASMEDPSNKSHKLELYSGDISSE